MAPLKLTEKKKTGVMNDLLLIVSVGFCSEISTFKLSVGKKKKLKLRTLWPECPKTKAKVILQANKKCNKHFNEPNKTRSNYK